MIPVLPAIPAATPASTAFSRTDSGFAVDPVLKDPASHLPNKVMSEQNTASIEGALAVCRRDDRKPQRFANGGDP